MQVGEEQPQGDRIFIENQYQMSQQGEQMQLGNMDDDQYNNYDYNNKHNQDQEQNNLLIQQNNNIGQSNHNQQQYQQNQNMDFSLNDDDMHINNNQNQTNDFTLDSSHKLQQNINQNHNSYQNQNPDNSQNQYDNNNMINENHPQQNNHNQLFQSNPNQLQRSQSVQMGPFEGLKICIDLKESESQEIDQLAQQIEELGGLCEKRFSKKCNIFLWRDGTLYKFQKAQDCNMRILDPSWVYECYKQNKMIPYDNFYVQLTPEVLEQLKQQKDIQEFQMTDDINTNNIKRKNPNDFQFDSEKKKKIKQIPQSPMSTQLTSTQMNTDHIPELRLQNRIQSTPDYNQMNYNSNNFQNNNDSQQEMQNSQDIQNLNINKGQVPNSPMIQKQHHKSPYLQKSQSANYDQSNGNINSQQDNMDYQKHNNDMSQMDGNGQQSSMNNNNNQGRWTNEEHVRFVEALKLYGKNWKKVEEFVGSRSGAQIRSHAQKFFIKQEREFTRKNNIQLPNGQNNMDCNNFQSNSLGMVSEQNSQIENKLERTTSQSQEINKQQINNNNNSQIKPRKEQKSKSMNITSTKPLNGTNFATQQQNKDVDFMRSQKQQHIKTINEVINKGIDNNNNLQDQQIDSIEPFQQLSNPIKEENYPMPANYLNQNRQLFQNNNHNNINGQQNGTTTQETKDESQILLMQPIDIQQEMPDLLNNNDSEYNSVLQNLLKKYNQFNATNTMNSVIDDDYTPLDFIENTNIHENKHKSIEDDFADYHSSSIIHEIQKEQQEPLIQFEQNNSLMSFKGHRQSQDFERDEFQSIIPDQQYQQKQNNQQKQFYQHPQKQSSFSKQ